MKYIILLPLIVVLTACACPQEWASGPGYCDRLKLQQKHQQQKAAYYAAESPLEKQRRAQNTEYCVKQGDARPKKVDEKWEDAGDFFDACMKERGSPRFR